MTQLAQLPDGITMEVTDDQGWIQRHWLAYRWYEQEMLEYIAHTYAGGTFVDVGASVGNHTVYFAKHCSVDKVYAFEPVAESFDLIYRNVILNDISPKVAMYRIAIGDRPCHGEMILPDGGNEGMWRFRKNLTGKINMQPLDKFELQDVTLIKIDAEGYGLAVLHGAVETIKRSRPAIFIEVGKSFDPIKEWLHELDYKPRAQFNASPTWHFEHVGACNHDEELGMFPLGKNGKVDRSRAHRPLLG